MKEKPQIGVYVRFPVQCGNTKTYIYGQIDAVFEDNKTARVCVFDLSVNEGYHNVFDNQYKVLWDEIERTRSRFDAIVKYHNNYVKILPTPIEKRKDGYYSYTIEYTYGDVLVSKKVSEKDLQIHLADGYIDREELLKKGYFSDPKIYFARSKINEIQAVIRNAPEGFKNILGARANLYPHQLDVIVKAFEETPCRLMLADEVGLGKTIEAGAIIKGMLAKNRRLRALIIVPDQLIQQWLFELQSKFNIRARTCEELVPLINPGVFLIKFTTVRDSLETSNFAGSILDLCVIDEAHKLIPGFNKILYRNALSIIRKAKNRIVISATPVSKETDAYLRLITLLNPERLESVNSADFISLAKKEREIKARLFGLKRDLPDFINYDLSDQFIDELKDINSQINDAKVKSDIRAVKCSSSLQEKYDIIQDCIAHISENYRLDENVFRHRKVEIPETIIKRACKEICYEPAGAGKLFYEEDCFNALYNILKYVFSHNTNPLIINMCKLLLQLVMSSPYAVYGNVIGDIPEEFETFFDYLKRWKQKFDKEIETISNLKREPSRYYSKLSYIIRNIEKEDPSQSKKFLVISQFPQTARQYYKAFCNYFGKDSSVLFVGGMTPIQLRDNVRKFQSSDKCRFVICDDTGGIGRNFQMADYIVHCELPWSPAILEQRIGRLDRIGRDVKKDVISIVIHSDYGIENDLFKIFSEQGLNVFNRSLCGMEIIFDDIDKLITQAFVSDPIHGLENVIEKIHSLAVNMDEEVEQELYYGMAEQLDPTESRQIKYLVDFFNINNNEKLFEAIRTWMINIGINEIKNDVLKPYNIPVTRIDLESANKKLMKQKVYTLPFQMEIPQVVGTFDRKTAVEHENLYYIAPQTSFFESIARCAICSDDGTITYIMSESKNPWEGFVLTWNIVYDYSKIAENLLSSDSLAVLARFLSTSQVKTFISIPKIKPCDDAVILEAYERIETENSFTQFKDISISEVVETSQFIEDINWTDMIEKLIRVGRDDALKKYNELLELDNAKEFINSRYYKLKAREKHLGIYDSSAQFSREEYIELFIKGMEKPLFELDSAAFFRVKAKD